MSMAQELTDSLILDRIHISNSFLKMLPFVLCIFVLIFIICIIRLAVMRKKENDEKKLKTLKNNIIGLSTALCIFAVLVGGSFYLIKFQEAHENEWKIETGTISSLGKNTRRSSSSKIRTVTYYAYIDGYNDKIRITEDEYNSLSEGDEVYVILDFRGNAEDIWSMEEYIYVGERLNDNK